jgi:hypothetical protein
MAIASNKIADPLQHVQKSVLGKGEAFKLQLLPKKIKTFVKGTVSRDFRSLVFSPINPT